MASVENMVEETALAGMGQDDEGRPVLLGSECAECGTRQFPAAPVCSHCMSEDVAVIALAREGTVYSTTIVHAGPAKWRKPMVVGYVDLTDGVRVFAHLRGPISIGASVEVGIDVVAEEGGVEQRSFIFRGREV
jgi:uncharacterized OB-fold protein